MEELTSIATTSSEDTFLSSAKHFVEIFNVVQFLRSWMPLSRTKNAASKGAQELTKRNLLSVSLFGGFGVTVYRTVDTPPYPVRNSGVSISTDDGELTRLKDDLRQLREDFNRFKSDHEICRKTQDDFSGLLSTALVADDAAAAGRSGKLMQEVMRNGMAMWRW